MRYQKILLPLCTVCLALGAALTVASNLHRTRTTQPTVMSVPAQPRQSVPAVVTPVGADLVQRSRLWPRIRVFLNALGDRVERPGKERLVLIGTLTHGSGTAPVPFLLVNEFPDRLRLEQQDGLHPSVLIFNGRAARRARPQSEVELIEMLLYDTPEHFLDSQMRGVPMRSLGDSFRLDDGTEVAYAGPLYSVYELSDEPPSGGDTRRTKYYCFDAQTSLLGLVRYEVTRGGQRIGVEVRLSGWQQVQGQRVPSHIERLENGQVKMSLTISTAAVSAHLDDAIFDAPPNS